MSQDDSTGIQGATILEELAAQGDIEAKREMAGQLLKGDGVDKDKEKAVSLLEDCVAHGDADAMVMLAKCCALGCGMKHDAERAEALLSDAATNGNDEARVLMKLINRLKRKSSISSELLSKCLISLNKVNKGRESLEVTLFRARFLVDCSEHIALLINIIPCRSLCLNSKA